MSKMLVAERIFNWVDGRGQVHVAIYMPELDPETGDYRCYIEVSGLPPSSLAARYVWGADSLQALQQAIQGVRSAVEPHKQLLRWGEDEWLGLPRPIPSGLSPEIDRRFENAVNRESARLHKKFFGTALVDTERKEHADKTSKTNSSLQTKSNKKNRKRKRPSRL
jgi:hypothetical protein